VREKLAQPVDRVSGVDVTDVSAECSNALVSHGTEAIVTGLEKTASERATLMLIGTVLRMPNVPVPQRRTYALTTRNEFPSSCGCYGFRATTRAPYATDGWRSRSRWSLPLASA
jgi:hypothetical protein